MGKTERVELRVDEELLQRVDKWMEDTGRAGSRSDALRQLVDIGLGAATGTSIQLSAGEKLNFMLLRDLLRHLQVKTETNLDLMAEVIYGGHYWAPVWEMQGLFHTHADRPADVSLVVDAMDVWSFIEEALEKLPASDLAKIKEANHGFLPRFAGFDGNNESTLLSIASFLVDHMGRFSRFKDRDLNSHSPSAAQHRQMAKAFESMRPKLGHGRMLSAEQILALLAAGEREERRWL